MSRHFEYWVGNRYVRSRSSNNFLSLISAISILGITIAVAVLIIVLSVVNGFDRELRERLLTMTAHGNVEAVDGDLDEWRALSAKATSNPRVRAAAPYVSGQSLLVIGERLSGVEMRGIDPAAEALVSGVKSVMTEGELDSLESGTFNIVLGVELANALQAGIGDKVTVILAQGIVTPAGVLPRTKRFTVSGLYRVGMFEYDRRLAFINIQDAQRLYRMRDAVTGVRLAVTEIFDAAAIVYEVADDPGEDVFPIHWQRRHFNFFRSIQITKSILSVILFLVVAVAAFNIVSTLVMVVKDKQSDIAILKTIGARPSSIIRIFVTQGCIIGITGTLFGVLAGILLALNLEGIVGFFEASFGIKFLAADVYFISDLPAELHIPDVVKIASAALMMALLSTVYPAWMAARTAPAEALRYD